MKIVQVSKHKIRSNNTVAFFSPPGERHEEICHVCGVLITFYIDGHASKEHTVLVMSKEYLTEWDDVVVGDTVYHTCSKKCKEIFKLAPFNL